MSDTCMQRVVKSNQNSACEMDVGIPSKRAGCPAKINHGMIMGRVSDKMHRCMQETNCSIPSNRLGVRHGDQKIPELIFVREM